MSESTIGQDELSATLVETDEHIQGHVPAVQIRKEDSYLR